MAPSAPRRLHGTRPSNHAVERTATRFAFALFVASALSLPAERAPGGPASQLSATARAQLGENFIGRPFITMCDRRRIPGALLIHREPLDLHTFCYFAFWLLYRLYFGLVYRRARASRRAS